ncbi:MAG: inositol monophosphatase [Candidatus Kerfeldbacteria bacterium]|nr:inositol monophosphatase [Candidatus Kerfeldbacteria bacterium]
MQYQTFITKLARQAGGIMRKHFSDEITKDWKKDSTPITIADKQINALVVRSIRKSFPTHGILAEEGGSLRKEAEYIWVCDPIDGTLPYSHAIPTSTFSLALVHDGEPIIGALYDPFMDRLYYAEKNKGATLNHRRIRVSTSRTINRKVIGSVVWPSAPMNLVKVNDLLFRNGAYAINAVVTTYFGMLVASGQLIANIFPGKNPWDTAAQKIIIEEAGGIVTDFYGHEQRYDRPTKGIIAANNATVHRKLLSLMQK